MNSPNSVTPRADNILSPPLSPNMNPSTTQAPYFISHVSSVTPKLTNVVISRAKAALKSGIQITSSDFDHHPPKNMELTLKSSATVSFTSTPKTDRPISPRNIHPGVYIDHDKLFNSRKITNYIDDVNYVRLYKYLEPIITSQNRGIYLTAEEMITVESFHCPLSPLHLGDAEFIFYWIRNWILYAEYDKVPLKDYLLQQNEKKHPSMNIVSDLVISPKKNVISSKGGKKEGDVRVEEATKDSRGLAETGFSNNNNQKSRGFLVNTNELQVLRHNAEPSHKTIVSKDFMRHIFTILQTKSLESDLITEVEQSQLVDLDCPVIPRRAGHLRQIMDWVWDYRMLMRIKSRYDCGVISYILSQNKQWDGIGGLMDVTDIHTCDVIFNKITHRGEFQPDMFVCHEEKQNVSKSDSKNEQNGSGEDEFETFEGRNFADFQDNDEEDTSNETQETQVDLDKIITICEEYINNDELAPTIHRRFKEPLAIYQNRLGRIWDACEISRIVKGGPKGYSTQHYVNGKWWPRARWIFCLSRPYQDDSYIKYPKRDTTMSNDLVNADQINMFLVKAGCPLMAKKLGHLNSIACWASTWKEFINSTEDEKKKNPTFTNKAFKLSTDFEEYMQNRNKIQYKNHNTTWSGRTMESVLPKQKLLRFIKTTALKDVDVSKWYAQIETEVEPESSTTVSSPSPVSSSESVNYSNPTPAYPLNITTNSTRFQQLWNTNPPTTYNKNKQKVKEARLLRSLFKPGLDELSKILRYSGEILYFKSSNIMKKFMDSSKYIAYTDDDQGKVNQIIGTGGQLAVVCKGKKTMFSCLNESCLSAEYVDGLCKVHSTSSIAFTSILQDVKNTSHQIYGVFVGRINETFANDVILTLLKSRIDCGSSEAIPFAKYQQSREAAGYEYEWKVIKKFTGLTFNESFKLSTTIRIILHIIFSIHNAQEPDETKKIHQLNRCVHDFLIDTNCESIHQILHNNEIFISLGESSPLGLLEWPLGIPKNVILSANDMVTYCRFGTIGRLYGGKHTGGDFYRGTRTYIRREHDESFGGLPMYIDSSREDRDKKIYHLDIKESQFITLLLFAVMLGAEIDGVPVKVDNFDLECLDDWKDGDLEWMQNTFAFLFGKELQISKSQNVVNVEMINWEGILESITDQ